MACNRPISVFNPSRSYLRGLHPVTISIPCGKCEGCRTQAENDWYFRSRVEYDHYKKFGSVWFITLTYNNENLPWCDPFEGVPIDVAPDVFDFCNDQYKFDGTPATSEKDQRALKDKIPCFNKDQVVNFIKKMRVYIDRGELSHLGITSSTGIKYFICSEYGPKTSRPHYHGILYLPFKIDINNFKHLVRHAWNYGFISFGKRGGLVTSHHALKYVCKYIHKDEYYSQSFRTQYIIDWYKKHPHFEAQKKALRKVLPFHVQSSCFGLSKFDDFLEGFDSSVIQQSYDNGHRPPKFSSLLEKCKLSEAFLSDKVIFEDDDFVYDIPQYYKRKILTIQENGISRPSQFAEKYYSQLYDKHRVKFVENFENTIRYLNLPVPAICPNLYIYSGCKSKEELYNEIRNILYYENVSPSNLFNYSLLRSVCFTGRYQISDYIEICDNELFREIYLYQKVYEEGPQRPKLTDTPYQFSKPQQFLSKYYNRDFKKTFKDIPQYKPLERLHHLYYCIRHYWNEVKDVYKKHDRNRSREILDNFNLTQQFIYA